MRDLELHADVDLAVTDLCDGLTEILNAVHEDWLVPVELPGEQERRSVRGQPHIATRVPKASMANTTYAPNPGVKCSTSAATSRLGR